MVPQYFHVLICYWICIFFEVNAQHTIIKNFGVDDGLPSSECYYIIQDSRHLLWIATDAGIVKYDGYTFKSYNTSHGLPDNTVFKIHEDRFGRIWFNSFSGKMAYYSYQTDSIHAVSVNEELSKFVKFAPVDFCFDANDTLWLSCHSNGYLKLSPPFYNTLQQISMADNCYYLKAITKHNFIYGYENRYTVNTFRLNYFLKNGNQITNQFKTLENTSSLRLSAIQLEENHHLFAISFQVFDLNAENIKSIYETNGLFSIISIYRDSKGRVWLSTDKKGVLVFQDSSFKKQIFNFLPTASVSSVMEDADGGFWITTTNQGLNYLPNLEFEFYNTSNFLSSNKIMHLATTNETIYASLINEEVFAYLPQTKSVKPIPNLHIKYFFSTDNRLVLNTQSSNLYTINFKKIGPIYMNVDKTNVNLKMVINKNEQWLYGFDAGSTIYQINKNTGQAFPIVSVPSKVLTICIGDSTLYIGTKTGLYQFHKQSLNYLGHQDLKLSNRIEALLFKNNSLFIATKGLGVLQYKSGKIIKHWHEGNGLISNICKCMIADSLHTIWIGTNKGLSRLIENKAHHFYCATEHLLSDVHLKEINQLKVFKDKLYIASNSGLGIFDLKTQKKSKASIPIYIENIIINQKKTEIRKLNDLSHNENTVEIQFKAIDFKMKDDIFYKYKLVGIEKTWSYTKNLSVRFGSLPPGSYTFLVYPSYNNTLLNQVPAFVKFQISPAFWQTWWFQMTMLLLLSLIIYWRFKRRIRKIQYAAMQQTLIDKKIANSELKALRAQMNPHFIFNAMNSIQSFILKNEGFTAQKYLSKFSKLMRFVLENSKGDAILLSKEIESLTLYIELEALRANFSFDFALTVEEQLKLRTLYIPPMLIQPYVENAILHGLRPLKERKGHLALDFRYKADTLICTIRDNGIGRAKAKLNVAQKNLNHDSMGLQVTNDRIQQLNQSNQYQISVEIIDLIEHDDALGTLIKLEIKT